MSNLLTVNSHHLDFRADRSPPFFLIAGPCVLESEALAFRVASKLKEITQHLGIDFIFKASYDKANRTSVHAHRGPGLEAGLQVLSDIRRQLAVPVLTDVHSVAEVELVAERVDILQIPAFLCRQTDLLQAAAASGKPVNIKKGQFLAPADMLHVVEKARSAGAQQLMVCERGSCFGYNNLIVDMRSLAILRQNACAVVFDATHSVQLPGGKGGSSDGQREFIPLLARAAVAAGVNGLFMETHPEPDQALSDGPNAWPLQKMQELLEDLIKIDLLHLNYRRDINHD
ncbi:MAG TPA: 3-deoxy-8-phosphooctulonate synthase [Gammaproteobacteria bacterium]|nr:3-deoxy-8-phosphooctulonate synthase [Gammaproteobacteria bacterium]